MTGAEALQLGFAVAVTLALIGVSFVLGGWRSIRVDDRSARDRIRFDEPDFSVDALLIDSGARSAVAMDCAKGEGVLAFALGDGLATRRFRLGSLEASAKDATLTVRLHDLSKPRVHIAAPTAAEAAEWARRIGEAPVGLTHEVS